MQFSVYLRFRVYDRWRPVVVGGLVVGGRPRPEAVALTPKWGPNPTMLRVHGTLFSSEDVFDLRKEKMIGESPTGRSVFAVHDSLLFGMM